MTNLPSQSMGIQKSGVTPFSNPFDLDEIYLTQEHLQIWLQTWFRKSRPTTNYQMYGLVDAILQTQIPSNPRGETDASSLVSHNPQMQVRGSVINHYVRQQRLRREIDELLETYGVEDWDGEGAFAIKPSTVKIAKEVANEFPDDIAKPDVGATPHGEIDFDWFISEEAILTIGVCPSGEIAFAGLFKTARIRGIEPWTGQLSRFLLCYFEQLRDLSNT